MNLAKRRATLEGSRLYLTDFQTAHIHTHFRWNNDAGLHHLESEYPFVVESFGSFARRFREMRYNNQQRGYDFEIHLRKDGSYTETLVGISYLADIDLASRRAHVGVTLGDRSVWNRGYGREALEMLLQFAFETVGLHRIEATALSGNVAWNGLLSSAGFQREGYFRDHFYRDGRYWDKASYAMLFSEYKAREALAA